MIDTLPEPSTPVAVPDTSPDKVIVRAVSQAVAVAALPVVSWLPVVLTPAKLMLAVPSKDTPPIVRAVSKAVAVAALPVVSDAIVESRLNVVPLRVIPVPPE